MIEKKEKIFLIIVALYVIVAECFYTFCDQLVCSIELLIGGLIVLVMFMKSKKLYIGVREILALATMLSWGVIMRQYFFVVHGVAVWFIYIYITKFLMIEGINRNIVEKVMWGILITLIIGFTVHGLIDTVIFFSKLDWGTGNYYYKDGSNVVIYWNDFFCGKFVPRTLMTSFLVPILAIFLPVCVSKCKNEYKLVITVSTFFLLAGIWCSAFGRTPFGIFFAIVLLQAGFFVTDSNRQGIKCNKKTVGFIAFAMVIMIAVVFLIVLNNEDMTSKIYSVIYRDGGILRNVRFQRQYEVIKNILNYPFGVFPYTPREIYGINYAHNVWVDMALFAGIIPFIFFTFYTIYSLVDMVRFLRTRTNKILKLTVVGMYLGYALYYLVEPVFNASIEFIVPWLMINVIARVYAERAE